MNDQPSSSNVVTLSSAGKPLSGLLRLPGSGFSVWTHRVEGDPGTLRSKGFSLSTQGRQNSKMVRVAEGTTANRLTILEASHDTQVSNGKLRLPGNGFSVWASAPSPQEARPRMDEIVAPELAMSAALAAIGSTPPAPRAKQRKPANRKKTFSFLRWAAVFLLACAIAALLDSENHRQRLQNEKANLLNTNSELKTEKQLYFVNWQEQENQNLQLSTEITQIEGHLQESRSSVLELTAQRNGLTIAIEQLKESLATTITDAQNTEATLRKMIAGLEGTNADLSQSLSNERQRLNNLEGKLAEVTQKLADSESNNQRLMEDNAALHSRVASLESSLRSTIENALAKETELRSELGALKSSNEELAQSLEVQREELLKAKEQLKVSEDEVAQKETKALSAQKTIQELSDELAEAESGRDALTAEKEALMATIDEYNTRIALAESTPNSDLVDQLEILQSQEAEANEQVEALKSAKVELLSKNDELQGVVTDLNSKLAAVIEEGKARETVLTGEVEQLSESNRVLKQSLEDRTSHLNELLDDAPDNQDLNEPLRHDNEELKNTVDELHQTLLENLQTKEILSTQAQLQAAEIEELNAQILVANQNLSQAVSVLQDFDQLKAEVEALRNQGENLETKLMQREIHISTLAEENNGWKTEAENLRTLLKSEREAQDQLQQFVSSLKSKIGGLQK